MFKFLSRLYLTLLSIILAMVSLSQAPNPRKKQPAIGNFTNHLYRPGWHYDHQPRISCSGKRRSQRWRRL